MPSGAVLLAMLGLSGMYDASRSPLRTICAVSAERHDHSGGKLV